VFGIRRGSLRFRRETARILSTIFNPFLTALALFVILAHSLTTTTVGFWALSLEAAFFTAIGPMLYVLWCYATDRIADLDMSVRSERESIFGAFIAFYFAGTIVMWYSHAPMLLVATMAGYTFNTVIVGFITRWWKISTHAIGITAPLVVLAAHYGPAPLPFFVLIPLVGWARVYLKAHTLLQVIAGTALGATSVYSIMKALHLT
jgi:membrane-associated phospholipid phosphatase